MKKLLLFLFSLAIFSCGGSGTSSSNDLTSDEINSIIEVLNNVMNDSGSGGGAESSTAELSAYNYTTTCNGTYYRFSSAVSDTFSCPNGGHVTYSGNLRTDCSAWTYYTSPSTYCVCSGDWVVANSMTFQYSDLTNNLNDCDIGGIIVDGTINLSAVGTLPNINISMTGTLGLNRRGPTGGLVPITSDCSIFLYYTSSTASWTGTICGRSVN